MNIIKRKLANTIRTSLLITINKELNEIKKHKKLLINSKGFDEYQKEFDNFIILERDLINSVNYNNTNNMTSFYFPSEDSQNDTTFFIQKINISKRRNAIFQKRKKRVLNLKPQNENKNKILYENIQKLKNFCSHLKSKEELTKNHNQRNKSEIIRRKKFSLFNNKNNFTIIGGINLKIDKTKNNTEKDECIIKLHKMWKSDKKSIKIESDKNSKRKNYSNRVKFLYNE